MTEDRAPRMSVVVPNYNHGHLIGEALGAISRQTMLPFEVLVIDDGSTDGSIAELQRVAESTPWLRLVQHRENLGVNAACNTGLGLVAGNFVLFSAADDCLSPEMVERAYAAAAAFPQAGIVFSDQAEMTADGSDKRLISLDLSPTRRYFSSSEFIRLLQRQFFYFHVSSVWFNVRVLRNIGGFPLDVRWHGDMLAAYAAAFDCGAVYIPGAVAYFRVSSTSYSSTGRRGSGQSDVLRAWHVTLKQPGWEARREAFVAAAVLPDYSVRGLRALATDWNYITPRLVLRLGWLLIWTKVAPFAADGLRNRLRAIRGWYRRSRLGK